MANLEQQGRALMEADSKLGSAMKTYAEQGWTWEDFEERLTELMGDYEIKFEGYHAQS